MPLFPAAAALESTVAMLAQCTHWAVAPAQAYDGAVLTATQADRSQFLVHGFALADASCASKSTDSCGVRTHALTEWCLEHAKGHGQAVELGLGARP